MQFYEANINVTSVTNVTNMNINKLNVNNTVTNCNKMLQNILFRGFVTDLLHLMISVLLLKCWKSPCNNVTVVTGEIYPLQNEKKHAQSSRTEIKHPKYLCQ